MTAMAVVDAHQEAPGGRLSRALDLVGGSWGRLSGGVTTVGRVLSTADGLGALTGV